jgi:hypothetical protein
VDQSFTHILTGSDVAGMIQAIEERQHGAGMDLRRAGAPKNEETHGK